MLDTNKIIDDYLDDAWWVKENANVPKSNMGLNMQLSKAACKRYWMERVYDEEIREFYKMGLFHIHNLGELTPYCGGWNLEYLLLNGFRGGVARQVSGPPKHLRTALGQIYNSMYTTQGEFDGAQAFNNFDTWLAPFIRHDNLNQKDVDQMVQEFIYEMNVPTRIGGQQPFTNITLDQNPPKFMSDKKVIIGGKETDWTYGDFENEMDMFNEAWWKQRVKGDFIGRPQPFPIETLNVTKDFDWDDEYLFKAVALRGSPYFANFINSEMNPEDVRSMCCRLRISLKKLAMKNGGFFGAGDNTGSIGICTMNMPLIAYTTKDEGKFFELLEKSMDVAKKSLELKRELIEKLMQKGQYPYSRTFLEDTYKRFKRYWANHFNTIGLVGMNEACLNLFDEDISTPASLTFSTKVLDFMRERLVDFQKETGNMYNLEATPAETTAFDLALKDKSNQPHIITAGTQDAPYYTNSTNLPVGYDAPLGFFLKHQDQLLPMYTGGSVFHIWNGEAVPPWKSVSSIIRRITEGYHIPYFTYSPTMSVCPVHGFISGKHDACPTCGETTDIWQRITGYFAEVGRFNPGKQQEFKERQHFSVNSVV